MDYTNKLNELYLEDSSLECPPKNKLEFIGESIFEFTTYDGEIDVIFAESMITVINHILNKTTFEYINESETNYMNYLMMVNLPFLKNKLEWGTSIRGAWFDEYGHNSEPEPIIYKINYGNIELPKSDIKIFLTQLIEWSKS